MTDRRKNELLELGRRRRRGDVLTFLGLASIPLGIIGAGVYWEWYLWIGKISVAIGFILAGFAISFLLCAGNANDQDVKRYVEEEWDAEPGTSLEEEFKLDCLVAAERHNTTGTPR